MSLQQSITRYQPVNNSHPDDDLDQPTSSTEELCNDPQPPGRPDAEEDAQDTEDTFGISRAVSLFRQDTERRLRMSAANSIASQLKDENEGSSHVVDSVIAETSATDSSRLDRQEKPQIRVLGKPASSTTGKSFLWSDWWLWEIGSSFLSLGCVVAIVVILLNLHGKPLSSWRVPIAPNALVSLFATIAKAALLLPVASCISQLKWLYFERKAHPLNELQIFDDASRGPWGALQLLWRVNLGAVLASCGSALTIVALAMDPFAQQIFSFPSRLVSVGRTATLGRAQIYDSGLDASVHNYDSSMANVGMQGAIYNGIYTLDSPFPFHCPTASCSWPNFTSIAVCSACQNVTTTMTSNCNFTTSDTCHYTTPNGLHLSAYAGLAGSGDYSTMVNSTAELFNQTDPAYAADIVKIGLVRFPSSGQSMYVNSSLVEAYDCSFSWCAKLYSNASFSNGTLQVGQVTQGTLNLIANSQSFGSNGQEFVAFTAPETFLFNRTFKMNVADLESTSNFLAVLFTAASISSAAILEQSTSIDIASALFDAASIPALISNVSTSMTNYMRIASNSTTVRGDAYDNVVFVHIRWPWLILPVLVVLLAIVFLWVSILYSRRRQTALWKSSSLALLFHGLDGWHDDDLGAITLSHIETDANRMRAQLRMNPFEELRLVRQ